MKFSQKMSRSKQPH